MLRRWTIRTRIAAVFGSVFLGLGALLLTAVYFLTQRGTDSLTGKIVSSAGRPGGAWVPAEQSPSDRLPAATELLPGSGASTGGESVTTVSRQVADAAAGQQLLWSAIGLGVAALLAVAVGWWTAARVLRPVHAMTATARHISETNLHRRIALDAPRDEITELATTFDALLDRLEKAFDHQRRFIANAAHELRTPLAVQRTAIQVGLQDPDPGGLARAADDLLDANRRSERLIDGLLVLAQGQHGLHTSERVDLARVVADETAAVAPDARAAGIEIRMERQPAPVDGDPVLLAHLAANLLRNAVAHNHPHGRILVRVGPGELSVSNTGPVLEEEHVDYLLEPFRRGPATRLHARGSGSGLGLSIVQAIATAHRAILTLRPNPGGGLRADIRFQDPASAPAASGESAEAT
ncbi:HAMP domain-containing sensor histidine kinase [Streptomyces sp. NPDC004667]|uniref:sensor histidine kinase n=1 Tax=Streptomyces sp. NPDC004667 TaxID=3154285 RepID=UPI0033AB34DF